MDETDNMMSCSRRGERSSDVLGLLEDPLLDCKLIEASCIKVEVLDENETEMLVENIQQYEEDKREVRTHIKMLLKKKKRGGNKWSTQTPTTNLGKAKKKKKINDQERQLIDKEGNEDGQGGWSCKRCPMLYDSNWAFLHHLRRIHKIKCDEFQHRCNYCDKDFISLSSLKRHQNTNHLEETEKDVGKLEKAREDTKKEETLMKDCGKQDAEGSWWCTKCGTRCAEKIKFLYHLKRFHSIVINTFEHKCPQCDMDFRSAQAMRAHIKRVHYDPKNENGHRDDDGAWWCSKCGLRYTREKLFILHLSKVHRIGPPLSRYTCTYCDMKFIQKAVMNKHIKNMHPDKYAQSSEESSESSQMLVNELNRLSEHGTKNKHGTWLCNKCSAIYDRKSAFVKHLKKNHNVDVTEVKFECNSCDEYFLTQRALNDHVATKHNTSDVDTSDTLESSFNEDVHKLMEYGKKNADGVWECNECGSTFAKNVRFVYHLKRNHEIAVREFCFQCVQCTMSFLSLKALRAHNNNCHPDQEEDATEVVDSKDVINKEGTRCDDGGWKCNRCGTKYSRDSIFLYHLKRYHGVDLGSFQHKCPYCQLDFMASSGLRYHVLNKHPKKYEKYIEKTSKKSKSSANLEKEDNEKAEEESSEDDDDNIVLSEIKKDVQASKKDRKQTSSDKKKGRKRTSKYSKEEQQQLERKIMNREGKKDSEGSWWCGKCGLRYSKDCVFLYHLKRAHDIVIGSFEFQCVYCKIEFISKAALRTHINRIHPEANENLIRNSSDFLQASILENHSKIIELNFNKDNDNHWICKICGSRFIRDTSCLYHLRRDHNVAIEGFDYKCNLCNMDYINSQALRIHVKRLHGINEDKVLDNCIIKNDKFVCKDCGKCFLKRAGFAYHYARFHETGAEVFRYQCKLCNSRYISPKGLRLHLVTIHGETDNASDNVIVIKRETKPQPVGVKLNISVGRKITNEDTPMIKHTLLPKAELIDVNNQEGIHQCRACGYLLSSRKNLMDHMKTIHSSEFDAIQTVFNAIELEDEAFCKICSHIFFSVTEFERHLKYEHDYEDCIGKIVKCTHCPFFTMSPFSYRMHSKTVHGLACGGNSQWPCKKCSLKFDDREFLLKHVINGACYIVIHDDDYECIECLLRFQLRSEIVKHVEDYHIIVTDLINNDSSYSENKTNSLETTLSNKQHECLICRKSYTELSQLKVHIQEAHEYRDDKTSILNEYSTTGTVTAVEEIPDNPDVFNCVRCGLMFPDKPSLLAHVASTHGAKKFANKNNPSCSLCSQQFTNNSSLRRHIKVIHINKSKRSDIVKKPAACVICSEVFRSQLAMLNHFRISHIDDPLINSNESFEVVPRDDIDPSKLKPTMSNKMFKCKLCPFVVKKKHSMDIHLMNKHWSGVKPLKCSYCVYKTTTQKQLENHVYAMHPNSLEAKDTTSLCDECGKTFTNKMTFYQHRESHNPPKYKCEYCNYTTHLKTSIENHKRVHTKERPFKCDYAGCTYSCTSQTGLKVHKFSHEPEKNLQTCDICGFKTVNKYLMNSHLRDHKKEVVNYSCEHCSYSSNDKIQLSMHCKRHMESKMCQLCDFSTKYKQTMKRHLKKRHSIVVSKDDNVKWF